jgi:mannose-binding lectin 2
MKLLLLTLLSLVQTQTLNDYSLTAPFLSSGINSKEWNFGGDAFMNVDKYVRLTVNQKSQYGWLWTRKPLSKNITKDWRIDVTFRVGIHDGLSGDGFALWLTEEKEKTGSAFGGAEKFKGLGCFFDTYRNSKHFVTLYPNL